MNLALADQAILKVNGVITVHLAPDQIMAALSLEFDDNLTTSSLEAKVVDLEERIRAVHPDIVNLFIKPQTPGRFKEVRQQRLAQ
jgi:divalent metal cation (Fe/Co/Zn/Cd) transporter